MSAPGDGTVWGVPAPKDGGTLNWEDLAGNLPTHQDEVQAAHQGRPTIQEQDHTHSAGLPAEDRGSNPGYGYGGMQGL